MTFPKYIKWFAEKQAVTFEDGIPLTCYHLNYSFDEEVYNEWACHIRKHYETDEELKESLSITEMSAEEYLRTFVIPQKNDSLGPTSRSNDFTEIMISDLLEFIKGYTVPRCKQRNRSGKTQSEHGTDIIAYKYAKDINTPNKNDELLAIEVKAGLSSDKYSPIYAAVTDSHKYDEVRHAHTLNYYRKQLVLNNNLQQAKEISRFQQKSEYDYIITYIAAAIISCNEIFGDIIFGIQGESLKLRQNDKVFLIHGDNLMNLAHEIYERCIK